MANPASNPETSPRKETWWEYLLVLPTLGIFITVFYITRPDKPTIQPDYSALLEEDVWNEDEPDAASSMDDVQNAQDHAAVYGTPQPLNLAMVKWEIGYPELARTRGIGGTVKVAVTVNGQGVYDSHEILSSPDPILSDAVSEKITLIVYQMPTGWDYKTPYTDELEFDFDPEAED